MLKRNPRVFLIAFLIIALVIPTYLSSVLSSTGSIRINSTSPSTPSQQVQAGGNVNLYFGGVTWSGEQFYLFLSSDGSSQISSGLVYTSTFSVYDVADPMAAHNYTGENGIWVTGSNWINGSVPSTTGLGNYYIKAIDQIGSTVAVTDTYITVNPINYNASLTISPSAGPGGVPITFTGSGYPASQNVTISYFDPAFGSWNYMTSAPSNAQGQISTSFLVPDLQKSLSSSDYPETYSTLSYRAEIAGRAYGYANYNEYSRGLKTIANQTAYGLFGNGTNLVSRIRAMVGDTISLSGKWFHPGVVYIRWDSASVVGTVTSSEWLNANIIGSTVANSNGSFSTSVVVPQNVEAGEHYLAVEDSQTRVIVKIFVSPASLQLSPASGPGGANVQFTGSGYPSSTDVSIYYQDPSFGTWKVWTTASSDSSGQLSVNAEMPDLMKSGSNYDGGNGSSLISFRTQIGNVAYSYADYTQYWRGLTVVGTQVAHGLFGNGTSFVSSVNARPGDSVMISGKWFHPGVVYVRFDGVAVVGTVTSAEWRNAQIIGTTSASSTGSFSTYAVIPSASGGEHYLSIEDSQTHIITKINVIAPVITPTPSSAPTSNPTSNPTPTPIPTPNPSLPTPSIDVSCKSTTTVSGFKVEINGNLSLNGDPLSDQPVLISYSVTGGSSWQSLTLVKTLSDGRFTAVWKPSVTGNYLVKATSDRTSTMNEATKAVNLALTPDAEQNVFTLTSNSTITQFAFNSTSKELGFIASGPSGTEGYVNIYIPKTIISDISTLKAYIDGNEISFNSESQTDSWLISFSYSHSQHTITMAMSEALQVSNTNTDALPQWLLYTIPVVLVVVFAVIAVVFKNRAKKSP